MAWRSGGTTNEELVENMWKHGLIRDERVKRAFQQVDRAHYCPEDPYQDSPQPIGCGATISAPHMHAAALEKLVDYMVPTPDNRAPRALDIGSGSGYLTHVMAELACLDASQSSAAAPATEAPRSPAPVVIGIEHVSQLSELGKSNVAKSERGRALLASGAVRFRLGDGRKGWVEEGVEAGYDAIHVGAAAREVHPELLAQLRTPGRMFIPVMDADGANQHVWAIDKDANGEISKKKLFAVLYVPLTDATYYA